ncbi:MULTISPECIES: BREX system ATP-binding domain-containing protein [Micromonospora]|uniref:Uncharacterized protein n=1 Tax=Micromonospora sicca TaxID=2202420 RepID=A0A317DNE8_9ACTN|nr:MULTISPECIES: BREX system ATP-binding domain-containing protein [unclassified Micromonospora]MBM0224577.1 DUF2791 family P-loop domain-containing protein [Micromonospora sp. ATA51]PWR15346.1 hypothetical protein DKT69_11360 [Micromonospora sp. 4G51]
MSLPQQRSELPGGGGVHHIDEYLDFVAAEYLHTYISLGGTAVRLVVTGDDDIAKRFDRGLAQRCTAGAGGFVYVTVDSAVTRVHLMDQLFFAVARQVDWMALAATVLTEAYRQAGFPAPGSGVAELDVAVVAAHHEIDSSELYRSVRRALERAVLKDSALAHEFRVAMYRLCQAVMAHGDVTQADRLAVLGWLQGEKVPAAQLRSVLLHTKIARHNARAMLTSLSQWVRRAGRSGTVLLIDLERVAVARRPAAEERDGHYYSKAATLDAYELLRQLIDATDELAGLFVAVLLPPELVIDEARGLPAYSALHLRVADEVRDRHRANPFAALIRLDVRLEAVR